MTLGPPIATHPAAGQTRSATHSIAHHRSHRHRSNATLTAARPHDELSRLARYGEPIYCGGDSQPLVALTFDDGPGVLSPRAIRTLRRHHDVATFFLVGKLLNVPSFAAVAGLEARKGMAFGNHTWHHIAMTHGTAGLYSREITRTSNAIRRATGVVPRLFRPPYEAHDRRLDRWLRSQGILEVLWSTDSRDSQGATTGRVMRNVIRGLRPGAIILMHDNRGTTETALSDILRAAKRRGLRTVTVPELLTMDPPTPRQLRRHTCG
jgi:peptidoglycan-N-acetylglucosamine deacetylase